MVPLLAILIYDCDVLFREELRNFLLAAGFAEVVTRLQFERLW